MSCQTVRLQLLELPVVEWTALDAHLTSCPGCSALATELRAGHVALRDGLAQFADEVPVAEALAAQTPQAPAAARGGRTMFDSGLHLGVLAAAAAAAIGVGLYATGSGSGSGAPIEAGLTTEEPSICGDLIALEPDAMLGRLQPEVTDCLERRVEREDRAVDTLRLLAVHAFSKPDKEAWLGYATELAERTPDDPDLHYKLALFHSRQGAEHAQTVIALADQAMAHRQSWTGEVYVSRVYSLYKLRASAGQAMAAEGGDRALAAELARDWLEYATVAGKDETKARMLCLSLADEAFCSLD